MKPRTRIFTWLTTLLVFAGGCHSEEKEIAAMRPRNDQTAVYLFLGFGDRSWSGGLYEFAYGLRRAGSYARVEPYRKWQSVAQDIIRDHPARLVLIGHSFGGDAAVKTAARSATTASTSASSRCSTPAHRR